MLDFYDNGEVDPLVIVREYKTYQALLESEEKELYTGRVTEQEKVILEYLSKTILSGVRPYELEILRRLLNQDTIQVQDMKREFRAEYGYEIDMSSFLNAMDVLKGDFVSRSEESVKYSHAYMVKNVDDEMFGRAAEFSRRLEHTEFLEQVKDIVEVGLRRYRDKYLSERKEESPFVLYEKYSRRDVSLLMNCGRDMSSTMYGMKRIGDDVFIFVTYHKETSEEGGKSYVEGKPE